jgi:hypothetical protein
MNESPKRGLLAAYGRLLGPLIRILIRNGVSHGEFCEAAREIFVDVASIDFPVGDTPTSVTRTAVLSGLSTSQVKEIWDNQERIRVSGIDSNLNHSAIALSCWHTDSEFTGPYGVPIELRLESNKELGFEDLVRRHIGDAPAKPLLLELLNARAIIETEPGWYRALSRFYMPKASAPAGMEHLSRAVENFVRTLDHNAIETDPKKKMFERQVYTADGILEKDLPRFKAFANTKSKLLLEELDNWISQLDKPETDQGNNVVTGLGIYHYLRSQDEIEHTKK